MLDAAGDLEFFEEEAGLLGLGAQLLAFQGGGGIAGGEGEEIDVGGVEAAGFVEGLERADHAIVGATERED